MFRSSTNVVVAALFLAACSALKPTDPDLTPINATAVLETHMVNAGIPDFPAFDRTTLSYTRANVQRIESSLKGSGPISRFVDVETDTRIERLDRNLAWALHAKSKQVTECPLKGCPAPIPGKLPTKKPAGDDKSSTDPEALKKLLERIGKLETEVERLKNGQPAQANAPAKDGQVLVLVDIAHVGMAYAASGQSRYAAIHVTLANTTGQPVTLTREQIAAEIDGEARKLESIPAGVAGLSFQHGKQNYSLNTMQPA